VFLGTTVNFGSGPIQVGLSPQRILAILSVIVLTWINVRGVKTAAVIQTSLTVIKTTALAALILLGVTIGRNAAAIDASFGPAFWPAGGQNERGERRRLDDRERSLDDCCGLHATHVDPRQHDHREDGEDPLGGEPYLDGAAAEVDRGAEEDIGRQAGKEDRCEAGERHRHGGD